MPTTRSSRLASREEEDVHAPMAAIFSWVTLTVFCGVHGRGGQPHRASTRPPPETAVRLSWSAICDRLQETRRAAPALHAAVAVALSNGFVLFRRPVRSSFSVHIAVRSTGPCALWALGLWGHARPRLIKVVTHTKSHDPSIADRIRTSTRSILTYTATGHSLLFLLFTITEECDAE